MKKLYLTAAAAIIAISGVANADVDCSKLQALEDAMKKADADLDAIVKDSLREQHDGLELNTGMTRRIQYLQAEANKAEGEYHALKVQCEK